MVVTTANIMKYHFFCMPTLRGSFFFLGRTVDGDKIVLVLHRDFLYNHLSSFSYSEKSQLNVVLVFMRNIDPIIYYVR